MYKFTCNTAFCSVILIVLLYWTVETTYTVHGAECAMSLHTGDTSRQSSPIIFSYTRTNIGQSTFFILIPLHKMIFSVSYVHFKEYKGNEVKLLEICLQGLPWKKEEKKIGSGNHFFPYTTKTS